MPKIFLNPICTLSRNLCNFLKDYRLQPLKALAQLDEILEPILDAYNFRKKARSAQKPLETHLGSLHQFENWWSEQRHLRPRYNLLQTPKVLEKSPGILMKTVGALKGFQGGLMGFIVCGLMKEVTSADCFLFIYLPLACSVSKTQLILHSWTQHAVGTLSVHWSAHACSCVSERVMCKSDEAATCVHNAAVSLARVAAGRRNWAALWCGHLSGSALRCLRGRSVLLFAHQSSWSQMFPFLGWDCGGWIKGADQSFYRLLCVFSLAAERLVQLIKPHPHQPMHANIAWQRSSIWFSV